MENNSKIKFESVVELIVRLGVLFLLFWWCIDIISPFLIIIVWGVIIAIALKPVYDTLKRFFKGKAVLSSVVLTCLLLSILVIPSWLIIESLFGGIRYLRSAYEAGQSIIPPPGESTATWPSFTQPFIDIWNDASVNISKVMTDHSAQVKEIALWLFGTFSSFGKGLIQFVASIIIAGVLFVYSSQIRQSTLIVFNKLAGKHGDDFAQISVLTIRNVVKGILGVALVQASMAGIGFFVAGIPFAGLWTILSLILAIIQVGAGPVIVPVIIYSFTNDSTLTASLLAIWLGIAMFIDNILKPVLLGRNAPAPMIVIFLGAIGGFISHGFIGLFLGAVILTLGYKLFITWIETDKAEEIQESA